MKRTLWLCLVLGLWACSDRHAGTGLETSTIQIAFQTSQGEPASRISVQFLPSGTRRYADSLGKIEWDTSSDHSVYAGGYREALFLEADSVRESTQILHTILKVMWEEPVSRNFVVAEVPSLGIMVGENQLNGLPAGQWTLVEVRGENSLSYPLLLDSNEVRLDSSLGEVSVLTSPCGLVRGIADILPAQYCWFSKADSLFPGDSVKIDAVDGQLNITLWADSAFGGPSSFVAVGLRFGSSGVPIDLSDRSEFAFYGTISKGDSIVVSVVTFDGVRYGFWNQLVFGQGRNWYTLPFTKFQLSGWGGGTAPVSSAIGFDFTLPKTSNGDHTLVLDSIRW